MASEVVATLGTPTPARRPPCPPTQPNHRPLPPASSPNCRCSRPSATPLSGRYRAAPDDWALVVTDIVDSTGAIARGLHKTVNFVAAMGIAGLRNLCAPVRIPFLFGGDGAVVLVPPEHHRRGPHRTRACARAGAARLRPFAARGPGAGRGLAPLRMRCAGRKIRAHARQQLRRLPGRRHRRLESRDQGHGKAGLAALPRSPSRWTTASRSTSRACPVAGTRSIRRAERCSR